MSRYSLLLPQGLEAPAVELLQQAGLNQPFTLLPKAHVPTGHHLGAVGAFSILMLEEPAPAEEADEPELLSESLLGASPLAAALAVVAFGEVDVEAQTAAEMLQSSDLFRPEAIRGAVELLFRHRPALREQQVRFRVGTERGGKHPKSVTSVGLSGAVASQLTVGSGAAVCADWKVELSTPNVRVVCLVAHSRVLVGLLLPPFDSSEPGGRAIPRCMLRDWLTCRQRPHMVPFVAAALVRLAAVKAGEVLLDPCAGLGIIPIEAALQVPELKAAISLEIDPEACEMATQHVQQAELAGRVTVQCGDALRLLDLGLARNSVDVVVSDLPFGKHHAKIDVSMLLRSMWEVLKVGGRVLLVGDRCVATALRRTVNGKAKAARCGGTPWMWKAQTDFSMGGIEAQAILLVKLANGKDDDD